MKNQDLMAERVWDDAEEIRRRWDICKSMRVVNNVQNTRHEYPAA